MRNQEPGLSPKAQLGCFLGVWRLVVVGPMWLVLQFAILQSLGDAAPMWAWVLYWGYIPACLLGTLLEGVLRAYSAGKEAEA